MDPQNPGLPQAARFALGAPKGSVLTLAGIDGATGIEVKVSHGHEVFSILGG